jgi:hypothetical protein
VPASVKSIVFVSNTGELAARKTRTNPHLSLTGQNVLNNPYALAEIERAASIQGVPFEGKKSALGIDLIPGYSFGVWDGFKTGLLQ